jgi:hypothetical protein
LDRHQELREELRRRKDAGTIPNSSSESEISEEDIPNIPQNITSLNTGESTNVNSGVGTVSNAQEGTNTNLITSSINIGISLNTQIVSETNTNTEEEQANTTNIPSSSYTQDANKRKFEEDEESSIQLAHRVKQNSPETAEGSSDRRYKPGESPVDYVVEKQQTEMPDIPDSDGGD